MLKLKKILFAEDDLNDVELTLRALEEYNIANDIEVVHDGQEALDYLYKKGKFTDRPNGNPVVIFLDIKMPKVDGLEVLKHIKSDPELKTIPVVILTSSNEEQDILRSYNLGVNAYVVKPVDFYRFSDAVEQVGVFWAILNEPPPNSVKKRQS